MYLKTSLQHQSSTTVLCNGTRYQVSPQGVIVGTDGEPFNVPEVDARRLLANSAWGEVAPVRKPVTGAVAPPTPKASITLLTAPVAPSPPSGPATLPTKEQLMAKGANEGQAIGTIVFETALAEGKGREEAEKLAQVAYNAWEEQVRGEAPKLPEGPPPPPSSASTEPSVAASAAAASGDKPAERPVVSYPAEPKDGEDWPDPTEEMELGYLRKMADAYDITGAEQANRKTLVSRIKVAMYPPKPATSAVAS